MRHSQIRHRTIAEIERAQQREAERAERAAAKHAAGCLASRSSWPFCSYCGRDVRVARTHEIDT